MQQQIGPFKKTNVITYDMTHAFSLSFFDFKNVLSTISAICKMCTTESQKRTKKGFLDLICFFEFYKN